MNGNQKDRVETPMGYFKERETPIGNSILELEVMRSYIQLLHEEYAEAAVGNKSAGVPDFRDYKLNYLLTTLEEMPSGAELPRLP